MFAQREDKKRRLAGVLDLLNDRGRKAVVRHGHQLGDAGSIEEGDRH
jgi:DNA polymerase-4